MLEHNPEIAMVEQDVRGRADGDDARDVVVFCCDQKCVCVSLISVCCV